MSVEACTGTVGPMCCFWNILDLLKIHKYNRIYLTPEYLHVTTCDTKNRTTLSSTFLKNNAKRHCKLLARTRGNFYFMIENLQVAQNKTESVLIARKTLKEVNNTS